MSIQQYDTHAKHSPAYDLSTCHMRWTPPEMILELAGDDSPELIPELIEAFRTDGRRRFEKARAAIDGKNLKSLRDEIHTIKGGAKQMGADVMTTMCEEIEIAVGDAPLQAVRELVNGLASQFEMLCLAMAEYNHDPGAR